MQNDAVADTDSVLHALSDITPRLDERRLRTYVGELFTWNPSLRLISKRDPARTASNLIRLSANLWDFVVGETHMSSRSGAIRVADIGSGGGFPGLVWKLLEDGISIDLVERSEKKHVFLERTLKLLSLKDARAVFANAQDLSIQPSFKEKYHLVTMLAVSSPDKMAQMVEPLLTPPGYFVTIRGSSEKVIKEAIGKQLYIRKAVASEEGIHVIYEKLPS
jgi:16S rRNA (guanine(527)-N(7))-methyltransferase RsmG